MSDLSNCANAAGSFNNPATPNSGLPDIPTYVVPDIPEQQYSITDCPVDSRVQEEIAVEALNISGAPLNIFKLLGVHEQGRLIDLTGNGTPLNGSDNIFDSLASNWVSSQTGTDVLTTPSWVGYDFGVVKTSLNFDANAPAVPNNQHIASIRITQPVQGRRALQIKVENSDGQYSLSNLIVTGSGSANISDFVAGVKCKPGIFSLVANNNNTFTVFFISGTTEVLGILTPGQRFNSNYGSFTLVVTTPFSTSDIITAAIQLKWNRVDIVNLTASSDAQTIRIKQSKPSRYWRIVPTSFSGVIDNNPWEIQKLELFDYQATRLDDIQDPLLLENRDRDYANQSVQLKVAYQPTDSVSDLSKFGFQLTDSYTFTASFAQMVKLLGRPIVVGDVLELPSEMQYDQNLKPVRKFLEVSDTAWAADGYTTSWRPIMYRFQASQLIPSQEHRDILGTADTQKFIVDGSFFDGIEQVQTTPLKIAEQVTTEALQAVPEKGANVTELASGTNSFGTPGTYDGRDLYVEDGLPPDGLPYTEGFKLPDVADSADGDYFRLNYDPKLNIASRLYKFSSVKNKWIFVETDRRPANTSHKPSQLQVMQQPKVISLESKTL